MRQLMLTAVWSCAAACGGITQSAECKKYLECTEAVTPGSAATYGTSYGPAGSCWSTNQRDADQCTAACVQGTQNLASGLGVNTPACK